MKRSIQEIKEFAAGLGVVIHNVLEKYVKEGLKEECRTYLQKIWKKQRNKEKRKGREKTWTKI